MSKIVLLYNNSSIYQYEIFGKSHQTAFIMSKKLLCYIFSLIYLKMSFIPVMANLNFHLLQSSNMLIWCITNISCYNQC